MPDVLNRPTLVLNKSWQPVTVRNVVKSLTKVINGRARVVDPYTYATYDWEQWVDLEPEDGELCIRAIDLRVKVPEVIVSTTYNKMPRIKVTFNRRNIFIRDDQTCQYCGSRLKSEKITIDHIVPKSMGGRTSFDNCVIACSGCNTRKANRTPAEAGMKLLKQPKTPRWIPTFESIRVLSSWENFLSDVYWRTIMKE